MACMVAGVVENTKDDDGVAFDSVEKLVGKAFGQDAAKAFVINPITFRRFFQSSKGFGNRDQEFIPQSWSLVIVPVARFLNVAFSGGTDEYTPFHAGLLA